MKDRARYKQLELRLGNELNIYINTLSVDESKAGIKTFLTSLIAAFRSSSADVQFVLICSITNLDLFRQLVNNAKNFRFIIIPLRMQSPIVRIFSDQFIVPICLKSEQGILLTPSDIATIYAAMPQVVVIQRPMILKTARRLPSVPHNILSLSRRLYFNVFMPISLKKVSAVVSPSCFCKKMLIETYPKTRSKAYVIPEGVSENIGRTNVNESPIRLPDKFIFFVGTLWQYKKADTLIKAFGILKRENKKF